VEPKGQRQLIIRVDGFLNDGWVGNYVSPKKVIKMLKQELRNREAEFDKGGGIEVRKTIRKLGRWDKAGYGSGYQRRAFGNFVMYEMDAFNIRQVDTGLGAGMLLISKLRKGGTISRHYEFEELERIKIHEKLTKKQEKRHKYLDKKPKIIYDNPGVGYGIPDNLQAIHNIITDMHGFANAKSKYSDILDQKIGEYGVDLRTYLDLVDAGKIKRIAGNPWANYKKEF